MVLAEARALVERARGPNPEAADLPGAAQAYLAAVGRAEPHEIAASLEVLTEGFRADDLDAGGFVARVAGAALEGGADPASVSEALVACLDELIQAASSLYRRVEPILELAETPDATDAAFEQAAEQEPREAAGWFGLHSFWPAGIALMSRYPPARTALRRYADDLCGMAEHHEGAHWLGMMVRVLDAEPLLVIEPATGIGAVGRASGIVDNFQLHMLLMADFPLTCAEPRLPTEVADVARGLGPQTIDATVVGTWNLYTWRALDDRLQLPEAVVHAPHDNWIWNEGTLADVPVFEGRRVVLLGPPPYARSWAAQRMFQTLPAEIRWEEALDATQVRAHLQRMRAAS